MKTIPITFFFACLLFSCNRVEKEKLPNILIAISDDQSWIHAGAYGCEFIETPHFDRIAKEGILFTNVIAPSPGCAPSRSALVTGRYPWQNGHAGQHQSTWPADVKALPDYLEEAGYYCGYTGKGVAPFAHVLSGRYENPAGPEYNEFHLEPPTSGISSRDYSKNFKIFLSKKKKNKPFYFWYGSHETHRRYEAYSGIKHGMNPDHVKVPDFLPTNDSVIADLLDYGFEIEWFDKHLGNIIHTLDSIGELDNTIIIVTSDNGMPFPAAKANCYEYGIHMPFAIRWGEKVKAGRVVDDMISFTDILPTLHEIIGFNVADNLSFSGNGFLDILNSDKGGTIDPKRFGVYSTRERHSSSRWSNLGYPQRAIRTQQYLYIWNFKPERWPAGYPVHIVNGKKETGFKDIDDTDIGLTPVYMLNHRNEQKYQLISAHAFDKRTQAELYDIKDDPSCLNNLIDSADYNEIQQTLHDSLFAFLQRTNDPRVTGSNPDLFETYPRYANIREFPVPEWTTMYDEKELTGLIKSVDTDDSPIVMPDSIWDNGMIAGPYTLSLLSDGIWRLENKEGEDKTKEKSSLTGQYISAYRFFRKKMDN